MRYINPIIIIIIIIIIINITLLPIGENTQLSTLKSAATCYWFIKLLGINTHSKSRGSWMPMYF